MIRSFLANAAALALATYLLPGITLDGGDWQAKTVSLLIVAAIFGLLNAFVKPILWVVTSPLILLTLGLFLWVINAGMLLITSWVITNWVNEQFAVGWAVDGWWTALLGALIITIAGGIVGGVLKKSPEHR
ncbi:MAG TPA: phage holin family protein [Propionibacteriaceae bacterium]|nr:phage holin family protein [Propionibacteriaceae bacterium]